MVDTDAGVHFSNVIFVTLDVRWLHITNTYIHVHTCHFQFRSLEKLRQRGFGVNVLR